MKNHYGPTLGISEEIHSMKYRSEGETFTEAMTRVAEALKDDEAHFNNFRDFFQLGVCSPLWAHRAR